MRLTAEQFALLIDEVASQNTAMLTTRGLTDAVLLRLEALRVTEIERPPWVSVIERYFLPIDWPTEYQESRRPQMSPAPASTTRWDPSMEYSNQLMHGLDVLSSNPFAALHFILNVGLHGTEPREAMRRAEVVGQVWDHISTLPLGGARYESGTVIGTGAGLSVHESPVPASPPIYRRSMTPRHSPIMPRPVSRPRPARIVFSTQQAVPRFASQVRHALEARQRVGASRAVRSR